MTIVRPYRTDAGTFLRTTREGADLTQRQLAALAHTVQPVISRYERGHVQPSVASLAHLLNVMGLDLVLTARRRRA